MHQRFAKFSGEIPHYNGRLLPDGGAQETYNVRLDDGILTPYNTPSFTHRLSGDGPYQSFFNTGDATGWVAFTEKNVSLIRGPVAVDRFYITGTNGGVPQMQIDGQRYPLALTSPTEAPVATVTGAIDPDNIQDILYAYTFVTDLGEESAPSPGSAIIKYSDGISVTVNNFQNPPAGRRITRMRLYRSQADTSGNASLYFIAERDVGLSDWVDAGFAIGEVCPSIAYDPAPDDLAGIISLPNGIMAAFIQGTNVLCFAEPWLPHAWPEKYQLTTDYPIVGLGSFGTTLIVMTTGKPYIVEGTAPENMEMARIDVTQPCISAASIVDLGFCVAYASPDGIVTANLSGATVATKSLFTRKMWQAMEPGGSVAAAYNGKYVMTYSYVDDTGAQRTGTMCIDFTGQQPFLWRTDAADALYKEPETGNLYMLKNGTDIYQYDPQTGQVAELYWRSKQLVGLSPANYGCILIESAKELNGIIPGSDNSSIVMANQALIDSYVDADKQNGPEFAAAPSAFYPIGGSGLTFVDPNAAQGIGYCIVNVYGDGKLVDTVQDVDTVKRLKADRLYQWMEIEVRATRAIAAISLASTPSELAGTS